MNPFIQQLGKGITETELTSSTGVEVGPELKPGKQ